MDEELIKLLTQNAGIADEAARYQQDMLRAQGTLKTAQQDPRRTTGQGGMFSALARGLGTYRGANEEAAAKANLLGVDERTKQMRQAGMAAVQGLPSMTPPIDPETGGYGLIPPEVTDRRRALGQALGMSPLADQRTAGAGVLAEADKAQLEAAKQANARTLGLVDIPGIGLVPKAFASAMYGADAKARTAYEKLHAPKWSPNSADANTSGMTQQVMPDGSIRLTPTGTAKPPSAGIGIAASAIDPESVKSAARLYEATGGLTMGSAFQGRGMEQARALVLKEHAAMFPDSNLGGNAAGYKADTGSLKDLTASMNRLEAFHGQLKKNIDVMRTYFNQIPDAGSKPMNAVLRELESQLGSPAMAGFHLAQNAVTAEAGRIMNNPDLRGQLTDTARQEMAAVHSGNYTLPQLEEVIKVIEKDASNRLTTLKAQIDKVKGATSSPADPRGGRALPKATGAAEPSLDELLKRY